MLRQITLRAPRTSLRAFHSYVPLRAERLRSVASLDRNDLGHYKQVVKEASVSNWESDTPREIIDTVSSKVKGDPSMKPLEKVQFHNSVLENLLAKDRTLVSYHMREIANLEGRLTAEALKEVIAHNSGRVSTSWELFERHIENLLVPYSENVEAFNAIVQLTIDRLLSGEMIDKESEEPYQPSRDDVVKAVFLQSLVGEASNEFLKSLVDHSLKAKDYKAIEALGAQQEVLENLQDGADFLKLVSVIGLKNVTPEKIHELLMKTTDPNIAIEGIEEINNVGQETVRKFKDLNSRFKYLQVSINEDAIQVDRDSIFKEILDSSEKLINDKSSFDPKIRASLLKVYGINKNELPEALKLYDEFSLTDGKNVDIYMTAMVQVLSYQAVQSSNNSFLAIAESLLPNPTSIPALQSLILAHSEFDLDKSLGLYNEYISQVSRDITNGVSQATKLTESLLTAYLSKRDREFANLIHDGAVTNAVVTGDVNIEKLKDCFRQYGVIVGEEEEKIDSLLKQSVLEAIKKLPVV